MCSIKRVLNSRGLRFTLSFVSLFVVVMFQTTIIQGSSKVTAETTRLRFSSVQLKTGVRLHYAERGELSGPVVLMLHGFTDSWFSYSRVLPLLDRKYHVYVLDQRGHGNSDRPQSGYTPRHFAADALAFMDEKDIKVATVVGHSMGSFVAQHVAAMAPDRVNKLVLVGSAASLRNSAVLGLQQDINSLQDSVPEKFIRDFQTGTLVKPVPAEFFQGVIRESSKLPARVWKAVINDLIAGSNADFHKIKSPTLIVWGDRETVFLRPEQDALLSAIPNSRLVVYEDTGHSPNWEMPERFVRNLEEFISPR